MSIVHVLLMLETFALAFSAVLLIFLPADEQIKVQRRLNIVQRHHGLGPLEPSFQERVVDPIVRRLSSTLVRMTPKGAIARTQSRLVQAGNPMTLERFLAGKLVLAIMALVPLFLAGFHALLTTILLLVIVDRASEFFLSRKITMRRKAFLLAMPDALDILTVSVEAGLALDGAMQKVAEHFSDPIHSEFLTAVRQIRLGTPRADALRQLADRVSEEQFSAVIRALIQAQELGIPFTRVLRVQSNFIREHRRQKAQAHALRIPVKMLFPMVFFIFPTLFIVLLGPPMMNILKLFHSHS